MKILVHQGAEYTVPDWAKFIATDVTGDVFVYENDPTYLDGYFITDGGKHEYVGGAVNTVKSNEIKEIYH